VAGDYTHRHICQGKYDFKSKLCSGNDSQMLLRSPNEIMSCADPLHSNVGPIKMSADEEGRNATLGKKNKAEKNAAEYKNNIIFETQ
jgi:hypothetical protein